MKLTRPEAIRLTIDVLSPLLREAAAQESEALTRAVCAICYGESDDFDLEVVADALQAVFACSLDGDSEVS